MMDNGFFYLLAVLCLVMLSVSVLRRSQQRRATSRDLTREQRARLRDQSQIRQSMEELLLQLEEVSRRINAQVDTKFVKLETVIRDADERIARLVQLSGAALPSGSNAAAVRRSAPPAPAATPPPRSEPRPAPPPPARDEQRRRIHELADSGAAPMTIADTLQIPLGEVELILNLRGFS